MPDVHPDTSPHWSSTTKLVVGLTMASIFAILLISFRSVVGPILIALILSYLFYPVASIIRRLTHLPWRLVVGLMYLLLLAGLIGLITWGGIFLLEQIQSLVTFIQNALNDLPGFFTRISEAPVVFGPFLLDFKQINFGSALSTVLGLVQPAVAQVGTLVGTVAGSFASIIGWTTFALILSFFITSETEGDPRRLLNLQIPGYREDIHRFSHELSIIWNAFLRGQLIVFVMITSFYSVLLAVMGVKYYFGLALVAGTARFLPYIGGIISWTANGLVALSQGTTIFGLSAPGYAVLVVVMGWFSDAIFDNIISPRIFSNALKIHPAAVMVVALVAFNVWGIVGVILAAPTLATLKLLLDYTVRKLFDLDPWEGMVRVSQPPPLRVLIRQKTGQIWKFLKFYALKIYQWLLSLRKTQA